MNVWVILASLILVAGIITGIAFAYIREGKSDKKSNDDHNDILGI